MSLWRRTLDALGIAPKSGTKSKPNKRFKLSLDALQARGAGTSIHPKARITDPAGASIGARVRIGKGARLDSEGGLTIGDAAVIGARCRIRTFVRGDGTPRIAPVHIGAGAVIGAGAELLPGARIADGARVPAKMVVSGNYPPGHAPAPPPPDRRGDIFFVLTTGRSGSTSIADTISRHPAARCVHEPRTQLIRLSTDYDHRVASAEDVRRELADIYRRSGPLPEPAYGESDQKLYNMVPLLRELFPACRFLWLTRDGRDVVASTHARGWFTPRDREHADPLSLTDHRPRWNYWRIDGARCGDFTPEEWESLGAFERNCWYWARVNARIAADTAPLPPGSLLHLRLEDFSARVGETLRFLELSAVPLEVERSNKANAGDEPRKWPDWSAEERAAFERTCGPLMDRLYAGWRDSAGEWRRWTP